MNIKILLILFITLISVCASKKCQSKCKKKTRGRSDYIRQIKDIEEDSRLKVPELIAKFGYPCEKHNVITKDGYILEIQRIPPANASSKKPPVIFVPGLISSSADWTILGPGKSLPLMLAEFDYDIWLFNARGNKYSRRHVRLDPDLDNRAFYNFSYHEIAVIDIPTTIDYILNVTNKKEMVYYGHSQGSTVSYILCAERPEYNDILKVVFSLGPSAYFEHADPVYHIFAYYLDYLEAIGEILHLYESPTSVYQPDVGVICGKGSMLQVICNVTIYYFFGYNSQQLNATLIPLIFSHIPAGTSMKQLWHYLQQISTGRFGQYDYGSAGNLIQYGTEDPPKYDISKATTQFYLFYSKNDIVNNEVDVDRLSKQLKNSKKIFVAAETFNHIDFLFGLDAPKLIFQKSIDILNSIY